MNDKSILVVDTPKNCGECLLWLEDFYCGCKKFSNTKRPKDCPLKPLPQRRGDITLTERTQDIDMVKWQLENKLINKGYNLCIDEILGEEKC